jgi:hypothetical protein
MNDILINNSEGIFILGFIIGFMFSFAFWLYTLWDNKLEDTISKGEDKTQ